MANYEDIRKQALQIFQQLITFAQSQGEHERVETLQSDLHNLQSGKLSVVVCGEFKRGKSSFINALLNEKDICPVDIDIATNLVTTIEYGERERISVIMGEGKEVRVLNSRDEIPDYVTEQGNPRNQLNALLMQIQLAKTQLKTGLILVDTPGVGGLNRNHTNITNAFLPGADVVLFVTDALEPLTVDELSFLRERILPHCQKILFVVTKKDKNEHFQDIIESNRQKLAGVLKQPAEEIVIIPVSNRAKKDYLTSQDEEDLQASNFVQLEEYLWYYLHNGQGSILLLDAAQALMTTMAELRLPRQTELLGYQEKNRQVIEQEKQRISQIRFRLQALLEKNSIWQYHLQDDLDMLQIQARTQLREGFNLLRHHLPEDLDDPHMRADTAQLVDQLQREVNDLLIAIYNDLSQGAAHLHNALKEETDLNLHPYRNLADPEHAVSLSKPINENQTDIWSKAVLVTGGAMRESVGGGTIGAIVGGIVGGLIGMIFPPVLVPSIALGSLLGTGLGGYSGAKRSVEQQAEREKMALSAKFMSILNQEERRQDNEIGVTVKGIIRAMRDDLTAKLTREKRSSEEALRNLERSSKVDQEQRETRIRELTVQLHQFDSWQSQVESIVQRALYAYEQLRNAMPSSNEQNTDKNSDESDQDTTEGNWADE